MPVPFTQLRWHMHQPAMAYSFQVQNVMLYRRIEWCCISCSVHSCVRSLRPALHVPEASSRSAFPRP